MRSRSLYLFALSVIFVIPTRLQGQTTPILRSDIRAGTYPNYGCDGWNRSQNGVYYNESRIAGGSPSGNDSVRWSFIRRGNDAQSDFGCAFDVSLPNAPRQGAIRYARWRIKVISPVNWKGFGNSNIRSVLDKTFILGNNCESAPHAPTRVIGYTRARSDGSGNFIYPIFGLQQNTGPGIIPDNHPITVGQWHSVQVRIASSSSVGAYNGRLDLYVDNNDVNTPTRSGTGIEIRTSGWGRDTCASSNVRWGEGSWSALYTSGTPSPSTIVELADFEFDDQFDSNWGIGAPPPGPTAPTNLRILRVLNLSVLPIGALGLILIWRNRAA